MQGETGADRRSEPAPAAPVPLRLGRLRRRGEFLACARGRKCQTESMVVQARKRRPGEAEGPRVGFTCSKKVGKAVERNRAKRRLRAAALRVLPTRARPDWDYVLIGRAGTTATRPFAALTRDLETALDRIHHRPRRTP